MNYELSFFNITLPAWIVFLITSSINKIRIWNRFLLRRFGKLQTHRYEGENKIKVAWVFNRLDTPLTAFNHLTGSYRMRVSNNALWMNKNKGEMNNSIYSPEQRYDVVIFFKAMGEAEQKEAERIKKRGGRVIFDANVNYYEVWGEFGSYSNQPTRQQQKDAIRMTSLADICIGDSTMLCELIKKYNPNTFWIPDNVNPDIFRFVRKHGKAKTIRLVWSGISFKADHLLLLEDVFAKLSNAELILVSDRFPDAMNRLSHYIKCYFVPYSDYGYAWLLSQCDIIISPKKLVNSYEVCHTEYKITLGMAAGLPVLAAPQQSYIEALTYNGGGMIVSTTKEWLSALRLLTENHEFRAETGLKARQTVMDHYCTSVIAEKYYHLIKQCLTWQSQNQKGFLLPINDK